MITIEHRPRGMWRLVFTNPITHEVSASPLHDYAQRIVWGDFVAQTMYWGDEEMVWTIKERINHESFDKSLEEVK